MCRGTRPDWSEGQGTGGDPTGQRTELCHQGGVTRLLHRTPARRMQCPHGRVVVHLVQAEGGEHRVRVFSGTTIEYFAGTFPAILDGAGT